MEFKISEVSGIGEYKKEDLKTDDRVSGKVFLAPNDKAFVVLRGEKTIEVRTDANLSKVLRNKYESVMQSRYFGRGGIEIVLSGQIPQDEIYDLVRLSYNMTNEQ
jgi:predicted DNA-binding protein (MmcQ/YjbR family)